MTAVEDATRWLSRDAPPPPVRIVHLGLGAFSRSHLAWYTQHAADADRWGIAAYTGRSRVLADALGVQGGMFTLIARDADGDHPEAIGSIVRAHAGNDLAALITDLAASSTAIVTLTITEAGYRLRADGSLDTDNSVVTADIELLRAVGAGSCEWADARPRTALGRLALGLEVRRRSGAGAVALMSCDNMPDNGERLGHGLQALAGEAFPKLVPWLDQHATFVSTSVDRITPRMSDAELAELSAEYGDAVPVVAETFRDWVIEGQFPAGRPRWEDAGARFVEHLGPWEAKKLWMLNGAHTLLACLGPLRGHATVAQAIADPVCRAAVEALWDEDERSLPPGLGLPAYREALVRRFGNPRIEHRLAQIATDTPTKLQLRVVPVALRELAAGRDAAGCAAAVAAWMLACERGLVPAGAPSVTMSDVQRLALLDRGLAASGVFVASVGAARARLAL